jgi:hypothetical protein
VDAGHGRLEKVAEVGAMSEHAVQSFNEIVNLHRVSAPRRTEVAAASGRMHFLQESAGGRRA